MHPLGRHAIPGTVRLTEGDLSSPDGHASWAGGNPPVEAECPPGPHRWEGRLIRLCLAVLGLVCRPISVAPPIPAVSLFFASGVSGVGPRCLSVSTCGGCLDALGPQLQLRGLAWCARRVPEFIPPHRECASRRQRLSKLGAQMGPPQIAFELDRMSQIRARRIAPELCPM